MVNVCLLCQAELFLSNRCQAIWRLSNCKQLSPCFLTKKDFSAVPEQMANKINFIKACSENVSRSHDQALSATIYILREYGPTGFLLKEEQEEKNFKIFLGQEHICSCPAFRKTKELCKHICWLLLKKFGLSRNDPLSWQKGLIEREINDLLYKRISNVNTNNTDGTSTPNEEVASSRAVTDDCVEQREIDESSVCPICLDNLLKCHQPVTFCRYGCGNSIHIKCMMIHAVHQNSNNKDIITCPMCRSNFVSLETLKKEERNSMNGVSQQVKNYHYGSKCGACHKTPIVGNCYKCASCDSYYLCQACFNTTIHEEHPFQFKQKKIQKWRPAYRNFGYSLPNAMANHLMGRELKAEDYETLLHLDNEDMQEFTSLPDKVIDLLPLKTIAKDSPLLAPGSQCCICLQRFQLYQSVRKLPCHHKFHRECIDNWLLHCHAVCPVDGEAVWNPPKTAKKKKLKKTEECLTKESLPLDITGCCLAPLRSKNPVLGQLRSIKSFQFDKTVKKTQSTQDFILNGTSVLFGQSHSILLDENSAVSNNMEAGNSLSSFVSQQCPVKMESSSNPTKLSHRRASANTSFSQPIIERVNSAPSLRFTSSALPPLQQKGLIQKLRRQKMTKHSPKDVPNLLLKGFSLPSKLDQIWPKKLKSNPSQASKCKTAILEKSKPTAVQHLTLEGYEMYLKHYESKETNQ